MLSISKEPQVRKAYAKKETEALRRCVFIGTTNDDKPIPMTGTRNRRFIPITVGNNGRDYVVQYLIDNRDHFFAHGIHCMKNNEPLFLSKDLELCQQHAVYLATNKDNDEENELQNYYETRKSKGTPLSLLWLSSLTTSMTAMRTLKRLSLFNIGIDIDYLNCSVLMVLKANKLLRRDIREVITGINLRIGSNNCTYCIQCIHSLIDCLFLKN